MGSLITAVASYLDIKQRQGEWFVRFDDIDPPRQHPDAIEQIMAALGAHGLVGDRDVDFQSRHASRYESALAQLQSHCFYCVCSRRTLAGFAVYPGTCRNQHAARPDTAIRVQLPDERMTIHDDVLDDAIVNPAEAYGDTIIRRRDGLWAYHLATAVDDGTGISHVLRGQDLYETTPIHVSIMHRLNLNIPVYAHIPLLRFPDGSKLSKQTHAPAVDNLQAAANLQRVLRLLGQAPPDEPNWPVSQWLTWGIANWQIQRIPQTLATFTEKP